MKIDLADLPKSISLPLGFNARGEPIVRDVTFPDFVADWVIPCIGGKGGVKNAIRNAKLYEGALAAASATDPAARVLELGDGFYVEIKKALDEGDLGAGAFRLAPYLSAFAKD